MDPTPPARGLARGRARGRVRPIYDTPRPEGPIEQPPGPIDQQMANVHLGDPRTPRESPSAMDQSTSSGGGGEEQPRLTPEEEAKAQEEVWKKFMSRRDYLKTKPDYLQSKQGQSGIPLQMVANYFPVQLKGGGDNWRLRQYRVDFNPEQDSKFVRKVLVRKLKEELPAYIYDGGSLMYSYIKVEQVVLTSSFVRDDKTEDPYEITVKLVAELPWNAPEAFQFFNIVVRKSLEMSENLTLMGRFYYNHELKVDIPAHRLQIWPGYKTVMRPHESQILLNVEMVSKVVRTDTVLKIMHQLRDRCDRDSMRPTMEAEICGKIVMTLYNRQTYSLAKIKWDLKVRDSFETKNGETTFIEYYRSKYGITITDMNQPLLVASPSKRDIHRGLEKDIILVPELCVLTGLTEQMRSDFHLMGALKNYLFVDPARRVSQIQAFMGRLRDNDNLKVELARWGVRYPTDSLVDVAGRRLEPVKTVFGNNQEFQDRQDPADWTKAFRSHQMFNPRPMKKWAIIVPSRDAACVDNLLRTIKNVSTPLQFMISEPMKKTINGNGPTAYRQAIDELMGMAKGKIDMMFIILPNNQPQLYGYVKHACAVEYGISSQCFLSKNAIKSNMSVCTKVAIQMCAKLGGEPWTVANPLRNANCMVVGYDVYHSGGAPHAQKSVGAMVASINGHVTQYTSTVSMSQRTELSGTVGMDLLKLLEKYNQENNMLPGRIIFYRDGVGEGQLRQVEDVELSSIDACLQARYAKADMPIPKFTFIVVSKRINTRLFLKTGPIERPTYANPPPGSIVDSVVTLPERYDFYLISQTARQGTVSPTSYNVLRDHSSLSPNHIQMFTFKMCHLYYNWSGTVAVPAVCQYAHKLAYLTGLSYNAPAHSNLANLLHFL